MKDDFLSKQVWLSSLESSCVRQTLQFVKHVPFIFIILFNPPNNLSSQKNGGGSKTLRNLLKLKFHWWDGCSSAWICNLGMRARWAVGRRRPCRFPRGGRHEQPALRQWVQSIPTNPNGPSQPAQHVPPGLPGHALPSASGHIESWWTPAILGTCTELTGRASPGSWSAAAS